MLAIIPLERSSDRVEEVGRKVCAPVCVRTQNPFQLAGGTQELEYRILVPQRDNNGIVPRILKYRVGMLVIYAESRGKLVGQISHSSWVQHVNRCPRVEQSPVGSGDLHYRVVIHGDGSSRSIWVSGVGGE